VSDPITKQLNRAVAEYKRLSNELMRLEDELGKARAEEMILHDKIRHLEINRDLIKELALLQRGTVSALVKQQADAEVD
jgi:hypothetical protein